MEYNFTFKTDADLEQAQRSGFDDVFDIVRVSVKRPDGSTMDFPLKSEKSFNNYIKNLSPQEEIEIIYQDKHGFEHGKLDYLNYLDENKKVLKSKMTIQELKDYIYSETRRLYEQKQLEENLLSEFMGLFKKDPIDTEINKILTNSFSQDRVGITSAGVEVEGYGKQLYLRKRGDSFTVSYKYAEPSDIDVSPALSQLEKFATNNGMTLFVTGKSGT